MLGGIILHIRIRKRSLARVARLSLTTIEDTVLSMIDCNHSIRLTTWIG